MPVKTDREYRAMSLLLPTVDKRMYAVYLHTTPRGKRYVGITGQKEPSKRWDSGYGYRNNEHFFRAIKKYGWQNIRHEVLFDGLSEAEAAERERACIKQYQSNDPRYGYNKTSGGEAGKEMSFETKLKISASMKRLFKTRTPSMQGKKHTAEAREKMRARTHLLKGAAHPNSKQVIQRAMSGEIVKIWGSCAEAIFGFADRPVYPIKDCCSGKRKSNSLMGYTWEYAQGVAE